jgi:serine/threonine protein kinase
VPAAVRRTLRRPSDPAGRTVPAGLPLRRAEDLIPLLPDRTPRFQPGDRPLPGADWELVELLGVGGFGEVWKARHVFFDGIAPVALKFCLDPQARERLLKHEAMILNQVMRQGRHPGIVPLLDASLSGDPPCLKYEYVEGGDLAGLVRDWQDSPPSCRWRAAAEITLRLAKIVAYAHRLSPAIVHRDLKPGNILLASPSPPNPLSHKGERGSQTATNLAGASGFLLPPLPFVGEGGWGGEGSYFPGSPFASIGRTGWPAVHATARRSISRASNASYVFSLWPSSVWNTLPLP